MNPPTAAAPGGPARETVYRDATVITGDPARPRANGLWVRGDQIAGVGEADRLVATRRRRLPRW